MVYQRAGILIQGWGPTADDAKRRFADYATLMHAAWPRVTGPH